MVPLQTKKEDQMNRFNTCWAAALATACLVAPASASGPIGTNGTSLDGHPTSLLTDNGLGSDMVTGGQRLPSVSPQAATDALKVIYRVPGVRSQGTKDKVGAVTTFICSNYSSTSEKISFRFIRKGYPAPIDFAVIMLPRSTDVFSTKDTNSFGQYVLAMGDLSRTMAIILASTTNIHCTAMIHNAATYVPVGIDLHMVRFNAHPGSVE
jgi:hypothetical protein